MSIHDLHPGPWEVVVMNGKAPNKTDDPCWIRHVTPEGQAVCVRADLTQAQAKRLVDEHNKAAKHD